jgi:hypothetical protein
MTPEQIEELRAMLDDAKEIAEERREKHMESHMTAALIRNSPNPASASGWQMAADYALKTARILEAFPVAVEGCAEVLRLTEANAALAEELARVRGVLLQVVECDTPRIVQEVFRTDGQPSKHDRCPHDLAMYEDCAGCVGDYARAALSHTGMTGPREGV